MARSSSFERVYIVAYDIGDPKRLRRVFRTMNGYGRWLQLSVFQCRLTARRRAELAEALEGLIKREAVQFNRSIVNARFDSKAALFR
jgi:CRISPR-associated protein Cas2